MEESVIQTPNFIQENPNLETPTNVPSVENNPPSVPPALKPKNKLIPILLIILILTVLGVGGMFAYKNFFVKAPTPTPTPVSTPEPTPDPTADWKTYSNKLFSFKYPPTWDTYLMGENVETALMVAPKEKVDGVKQMEAFGGGSFLTLVINTSIKPFEFKSDEYQSVSSKPITVGGINGTVYSTDIIQDMQGFSKGNKITTVDVKVDNTYISIGLLDQEYKETYDQILSTFTITDETPSGGATSCEYNGKTYQNDDSVPSGDSCNTCSCDNGKVSCTTMMCD